MSNHANKNKLFKATLATATAVSLVGGVQSAHHADAASNSFKDIKQSDYYYASIQDLANRNVISGFTDGTFRPNDNITRAQAAKILALTLQLDLTNTKNPNFTDIDQTHPNYQYIAALVEAGVFSGYADQSFKPNEFITRGQLAKALVLAFNLSATDNSSHPFKDAQNKWYSDFVNVLYKHNIAKGTTASTFEPGAYVKRGQFAAFITRSENISSVNVASIVDINNDKITLSTGNYTLSNDLKSVINHGNRDILKNATIQYSIKNNTLVSVSSIQLNTNGTAEKPLILDGNNAIFNGSIQVNADHLALKNIQLQRDLKITANAKTSFTASLKPIAAIQLRIVFENANLKNIEISRDGASFEAKGTTKLEKLDIKADVSFKADQTANVTEILINTNKAVTIDAIVEKIIIALKESQLSLSENAKVKNLEIPKDAIIENIIKNFDQLKTVIENINNQTNPNNQQTPSTGPSSPSTFKLSIMHYNDSHSNVEKMPRLVTAVNNIRATDPQALLLNAGDVFSGTLYFNEFKGEVDSKLMNLLKVDAMTFGNHEFDLGSSNEGHKALADFIQAANFPFVSSNVDFSKDNLFTGLFNTKIETAPEKANIYTGIVKVINGQRVGIFGLTTEETKELSSPGQIEFKEYIVQAKMMVSEFEKMGVNKVIALTHLGYDDNALVDNDLTLAKEVEGIDVIVGGHSHTQLSKPTIVKANDNDTTPTVIVQAYQYADYLGHLNVEFDNSGVVKAQDGKLINLNETKKDENNKDVYVIKDDATALEILAPYKQQVTTLAEQEIGVTLTQALPNPRLSADSTESVRKNETALGNLITDGMLAKAKSIHPNVIMAMQNGGGIRSSIEAGPITVGEVIKVLPFGNTLATVELTGAEIKQTFETSFKNYPSENGGFLHVAGAKVKFDSAKPVGQRIVSIQYKDATNNYVDILPDTTYTVATNAFTAKGGDGYDVLAKAYTEGRVKDLGLSDWENFRDHLISLQQVNAKIEGRILDIQDPGVAPDASDAPIPPFYNSNSGSLAVQQIARYNSGKGELGTEIFAYDALTKKAFVTNGAVGGFDILSLNTLASAQFTQLQSTKRVVISDYGIPGVQNITSIAVHPTADLVAIAAYGEKTNNGYIVFTTKTGKYVKHVQVGALPDMVTFTPDGTKAIVANEGEPNDDVTIDPDGSISIIDIATMEPITLTFTPEMLDNKVRISFKGKDGLGATIAQQLEPEYVTVSDDSTTAYVSLQENNAIATVDLVNKQILHIKGLGVIDHSIAGNEMDANKDDKAINITKQPILTFHMPDAIDTFTADGKTYILTPNEGDSRDYTGYSEVVDVSSLTNIALKAENYSNFTQEELDSFNLTTLAGYKITKENGLSADGTTYEALYGYGGRSFSIFEVGTDSLTQTFDSGKQFEDIINEKTPNYFNINSDKVSIDNRSDDKGPEPETAVVGDINGKKYAFIALERYSGIIVYDLTNVASPQFVTLISSRDFTQDASKVAAGAGDVSPEGLQFIPAEKSPTGKALLAATHEISGTVAIYELEVPVN